MFKSCSRCGKIHDTRFQCGKRAWHTRNPDAEERKLRRTNAWKEKSVEIRDRSNYLCAACKAEGKYTYEGVEVHHIVKVTDDPSLLLEDSNLICLCQQHHRMADRGDISGEKLRMWVNERDGHIPPWSAK